jgi:Holliday junction DNA helicase RuvA
MIAVLQGKIIDNKNSELVLLASSGVGYRINASLRALEQFLIGKEVEIETYLVVREDALELFGFADKEEKRLFVQLLQVGGIGPKTALHILSLGTVGDISSAIGKGDVTYLTKVSGIGKKTAERIVVELQSKLKEYSQQYTESDIPHAGSVLNDVADGLEALGYSALEAREVIKKLDSEGKTSEQLLKQALQMMK